ncbi:hypothetical protein BD309DRAFT_434026 [Dichomitus squalens]|nr:hypothetical protein BD309DRAFT_434026 [Dichomitus squalens]
MSRTTTYKFCEVLGSSDDAFCAPVFCEPLSSDNGDLACAVVPDEAAGVPIATIVAPQTDLTAASILSTGTLNIGTGHGDIASTLFFFLHTSTTTALATTPIPSASGSRLGSSINSESTRSASTTTPPQPSTTAPPQLSSTSTPLTSSARPPRPSSTTPAQTSFTTQGSTSTTTSSQTTSPSSQTTDITSQTAGSHQGVNIRIVAGVVVAAVLAAIGCTVLFLRLCRRPRGRPTSSSLKATHELEAAAGQSGIPAFGTRPQRDRGIRTSFDMVLVNEVSQVDGVLVSQLANVSGTEPRAAPNAPSEKLLHNIGRMRNSPATGGRTPDDRGLEHRERTRRHDTDGAVRLAGGRVGDDLGQDIDTRSDSVGSTLPPPYYQL